MACAQALRHIIPLSFQLSVLNSQLSVLNSHLSVLNSHLSVLNYIKVSAAIVHRHIIVAIAGDAAELSVFIERIAAGRIRDQREEILVAQIVDPRPRSLRIGNHILAACVIKMTVFFLIHGRMNFLLVQTNFFAKVMKLMKKNDNSYEKLRKP